MPRQHAPDSLRPIAIEAPFLESQPASVLYSSGRTKVLCVATLEAGVPPFREGSGKGWATAEYDLLPGSTQPRKPRERNKLSGRTQEIQRLIGRSLRSVLDFKKLDGWTLRIDCDVLQADGGTRTASISGAFVAAALACRQALRDGKISAYPLTHALAATSVGVVDGRDLLDLCYEEDSAADVDLNVVLDDELRFIEVQGTAEGSPFSRERLDSLIDLAVLGIEQIFVVQRKVLEQHGAF